MYVRQVTAHYKPGKFDLLMKKMEDEVIPQLKKQTGFRDEFAYFDEEKKEAIAMSIWETKQDAENYARELYPDLRKTLDDTIEGTPEVRSYEVANSTWYGIHAS